MKELLIKTVIVSLMSTAPISANPDVASITASATAAQLNSLMAQGVMDNADVGKYPLEENINAQDISEDEKLAAQGETDTLVPQEEAPPQQEVQPQPSSEPEAAAPASNVIETYNTSLPVSIALNLKYEKYLPAYDYLLLSKGSVNIREAPTTGSKIVRTAGYFEKVNVTEAVKGEFLAKYNSSKWYKVYWYQNGTIRSGYMFSSLVEKRNFQFGKMASSLENLRAQISSGKMGYVNNYKNRNGLPPLYKGTTSDKYGTLRDQSAPAYASLGNKSELIYFDDGKLLRIIGEQDSYYKVESLERPGSYFVPKKYVYTKNAPSSLGQVIVVDRKNQNEAVFEWTGSSWQMISYTFATTGAQDKYRFETPLGYFMAIERRSKFLYLDDITKEIAGYAPYAVRFSGGAYVHGVPVDYIKKNGQLIDPGQKETLYTLGTVPRSHKCVRNYTSHAKFLYDWVKVGQASVIVIE